MQYDAVTKPRTPTLEALYLEHVAHLQESYAQALAHTGFDALVIHSGQARLANDFDDRYWPLQPTPAFTHWSPWREPDVYLLIVPGGAPAFIYRTTQDYWESAAEPESHHFWNSFEHRELTGDGQIGAAVRGFLPGGRVAFIGESRQAAAGISISDDAINPSELIRQLDRIRARKTEYERTCMAEANRRASAGHRAVAQAFAHGEHSELKLHLLYLERTLQDDSETPYKNIVALDEHAAVLHHVNYSRSLPVGASHSLLLDAGATCLGYASDITRTMAKGPGSRVFAELIARMEGLQAEIIRRVRPGLEYESLHDQAHELLAPILRDLGIARASEEELVASGATRAFFPHGLGHSLGIQVHDVGCRPTEPRPENRFLRNTSLIFVGHVFTIEPGCYFIPQLLDELREKPVAAQIDWALVGDLARFGGVRIEDNIAVTDAGTINLTRDNWAGKP